MIIALPWILFKNLSFLQVTPNYIASGGDGYKFETWKTRDRILGALDTEVCFFSCSGVDTDIIRSGILNPIPIKKIKLGVFVSFY